MASSTEAASRPMPLPMFTVFARARRVLVALLSLALVCGASAATFQVQYTDPAPPDVPLTQPVVKKFGIILPDEPIGSFQAILCETRTLGPTTNALNFFTSARVVSFYEIDDKAPDCWFPRSPAGVEVMLDAAVAATGRNDLRDLPLFFTGSSRGGHDAAMAGGRNWSKVAAAVSASIGDAPVYRADPPTSAAPGLITHGASEVNAGFSQTAFLARETYNARQAYHISWDSGHSLMGSENEQEFPYLFMMENLRLRQQLGHTELRGDNGRLSMPPVPVSAGWLGLGSYFGNNSDFNYTLFRSAWPVIGPEPTFTARPKSGAFWFPSEVTARAYQAMQGSHSFQPNTGLGHFSIKVGLPTYPTIHLGETLTIAPWFNPSHAASIGTIATVELWAGGRPYATRTSPDANGRWTFTYRPANCEPQAIILVATTTTGLKIGTYRLLNVLPARAAGALTREYWTNIPGETVASLTASPAFQADAPTARDSLITTQTLGWSGSDNPVSETNYADNYGQRLRGYVDVKAGTVTFYLAASKSAELWFNPHGDDPAGKILIAREDTGRPYRSWTDSGSARSVQFNFTTARRCYIEVLHKGGTGDDHCTVAWDGTGIGTSISGGSGKSIPRVETLRPFNTFDPLISLSLSGGTGQVSIPSAFDEDFRVALASDNPSVVSVPAIVVIPAGQTSATFGVTPGTLSSPVTVRASAYGWTDARFVVSPAPAPAIQLFGRGAEIVSGDSTPATNDGTDFGRALLVGGTVTRTFTVCNAGSASLTLGGATLAGAAAADFALLDTLPASLAPGASANLRVRFDPSAAGTRNATIHIASADPATPTATFAVAGVCVDNSGGPEINITGNNQNILAGDTTPALGDGTDFGTTNISNGRIFKNFVIQNTGTGTLDIAGVTISGTHAADFTIAAMPFPSLPAGNVVFTIRFAPSATGVRTATVTIANNDSDEGSYTFAIRGTGAAGPEIVLSGNGTTIGNNDTTPVAGDNTAFGNVSSNAPVFEKTFTIANTGADPLDLGTITIIPVTGAGGFFISQQPLVTSVPSGGSTTFKVRFSPLTNGAVTATVSIPNNDADENPTRFRVSATGQTPEIECAGTAENILTLTANVAPSSSSTNFGSVSVTGTTTKTINYTLWNSSTVGGPLTVRSFSVTGPNAAEFTVLLPNTVSLPLQLGTYATRTFDVRFKPLGTGTRRATIVVDSTDPDENPFTFDVQGVGTGTNNTSTLAFAATSVTAYEEAPATSVTVRRVGSTIGAVSVYYTLDEGTATAGVDFDHVSGQLTWADGDGTPRTIEIPMIDDDLADAPETFAFRLYSAVGVSLPAPADLTITLRDQETNTAPVVTIDSPSSPALVSAGRPLRIEATTTDDGYRAPLAHTWSLVSGPTGGSVAFDDPAAEDTSVIFNLPGTYVLRLTAFDSHLSGSADITVNVSAAPRLALHLRLDEVSGYTAADSSGNGLHGTLTGLAYWQPANGRVGGSLVVNRAYTTIEYVRVPDDDLLDGSTALTIAAWIRPDDLYTEERGILAKSSAGSNNSYRLSLQNNQIRADIDVLGTSVLLSDATAAPIPAGSWTHVAYVFDGSQASSSRARLYINGVLNRTASESASTIPNQPSNLHIGTWDTGAISRAFVGQIDDVRIYRAALSASEVAALANFHPVLSVSRAGTAVAHGAIDTVATPVTLGSPATINYQLANPGFGALTFSGPVSLANAANCTAAIVAAPATSLAPGATTTLGVRVTPTATGVWNVDLTVPSNDPARANTTWTLAGTARTAYAAWTAGTNWGALDSASLADPDGDGTPNFLEYALGRDPLVTNSAPATTVTVTPTPALAIAFTRVADPTLTYIVEATDNLGSPTSWTTIWSSTGIANVAGPVTVTDTVSLAGKTRRFLRLRVTGN